MRVALLKDNDSGQRIFISYAKADQELIKFLISDLETSEMFFLVNEKEIDEDDLISKDIREKILTSDFFCPVLSESSQNLKWIESACRLVLEKQISTGFTPRILPILLNNKPLPVLLRDKKIADFTQGYQNGFEQLFIEIYNNIDLTIEEKVSRPDSPQGQDITSQDDKFIKKFRRIIEKYLSDSDLNIDKICQEMEIGRTTLFTKVKRITGETPNEYINSYRLEQGALLLKKNYGKVKDIAAQVGFEDPNYFGTLFKKKHSHNPKKYQLSQLAKQNRESKQNPINTHKKSIIINSGRSKAISSTEQLDNDLILQGSANAKKPNFFSDDKEALPLRDDLFGRIKEHYNVLMRTFFKALAILPIPKIIEKLEEAIKEWQNKVERSSGFSIARHDFYEILHPHARKNARSVAAVFFKSALLQDNSGGFGLKVKNYGNSFNLAPGEPFRYHPVIAKAMSSGVLVGDDVLLTAAHIVNERNVSDLRIIFDYIMRDPDTPITTVSEDQVYRGVKIIDRVHNPYGGWALVKLDRKVKDRDAVTLFGKQAFYEQPFYVIGHPCGLPLKHVSGGVIANTDSRSFMADLSVYSGNLGSPVFCAESHKLIGIVYRSRARDFRWTGNGWRSFFYPHVDIESQGTHCSQAKEFEGYLKKVSIWL